MKMVTVAEILSSEKPKAVKKFRGFLQGHILCSVELLDKELSKKLNEKYLLDKISHQLIKIQQTKLTDYFEDIQKVHDKYMNIHDEGNDDEADYKLLEDDIAFMKNIMLKVCPIFDELKKI